jgi:epoxyqueuosine reductase
LGSATLVQLLAWSEADFLRITEGSAIRRIGHVRWLRNLAVAAGNALRQSPAEPQGLRTAVSALLHHDSDLVREHAAWALQA